MFYSVFWPWFLHRVLVKERPKTPPPPQKKKKKKKKYIYIYVYIYNSRTPQLVGSFEALRFIEAEEKGKIRQKKAKEDKN